MAGRKPTTATTPLEPRERNAINHLMRGRSKTDALRLAGYAEGTAKFNHSTIWDKPNVKAELHRRQMQMQKKAQIDAEWVLERLRRIADADLGELLEVHPDGSASFDLKKLTPDMRAALAEFAVDTYVEGRGKNAKPVKKMRIKMADKLRALEMIARYLGMFQDKLKIEAEEDIIARIQAGRNRLAQEEKEED